MTSRITLRGVRTPPLRNIDIDIHLNRITAITGPRDSGKRALLFGTLFSAGYLQYIQSQALDCSGAEFTRQPPRADQIRNLPPVVKVRHGIEKDAPAAADMAGIYDPLSRLFLNAAAPVCPGCGLTLRKFTMEDILRKLRKGSTKEVTVVFQYQGDAAYLLNRGYYHHRHLGEDRPVTGGSSGKRLQVILDRVVVGKDPDSRLVEALEQSLARQRYWVSVEVAGELHRFPVDWYCTRCQRVLNPPPETLVHYRFRGKPGARNIYYPRRIGEYTLGGHNLERLMEMSFYDLGRFLEKWDRTVKDNRYHQPVKEISEVLRDLIKLGLGDITAGKDLNDLSAGERLFLKLTALTRLGMNNLLLLMDQPYPIHHPADIERGIELLVRLRDNGNTIVLIDYDPRILKIADRVIQLGPGSGNRGGQLTFTGSSGEYLKKHHPHRPDRKAEPGLYPKRTRPPESGGRVAVTQGQVVLFTGPAGSGKSRLLRRMAADSGFRRKEIREYRKWRFGLRPSQLLAGFLDLYAPLCRFMADSHQARIHNYLPGDFSRYSPRGRCPACRGRGRVGITGGGFPPLTADCRLCRGSGLRKGPAEIRYRGVTMGDILEKEICRVLEMPDLVKAVPQAEILEFLNRQGLGYLKLGQPVTELSPGTRLEVYLVRLVREPLSGGLVLLDNTGRDQGECGIRRIGGLLRETGKKNTVLLADNTRKMVEFCDKVFTMEEVRKSRGVGINHRLVPLEPDKKPGNCRRGIDKIDQ